MSQLKLVTLTTLGMIAFAGNSILCRAALAETDIDAGSFTSLRLISGALMLWLLLQLQRNKTADKPAVGGDWLSALMLFIYAAGFSFAYINLPAGSGALLLFGAVQISMISAGLIAGEKLGRWQIGGYALAFAGLIGLLLPGAESPSLLAALLMVAAGIAWGVYSLRGRQGGDPLYNTGGNFIRAVPMTAALSLLFIGDINLDSSGIMLAIASGAITSGIGYAIWYAALPALQATTAAIVQLSVPIIATVGGLIRLDEAITLRLMLASVAVLGGIALFVLMKGKDKDA